MAIQEESDEEDAAKEEEKPAFKVSNSDEPVITEEDPKKPKITEVKSEDTSNWWKASNTENLDFDGIQVPTPTQQEKKFTRV